MQKNRRVIESADVNSRTVVVIAGPTASGKSGLALELAVENNGVVINADAMQVYKGVSIITAAPTEEDKKKAEHQLYEMFEPEHAGSVAEWLTRAVETIRDVWQRDKLPIVVGGTGFYIENLVGGISPIPETGAAAKRYVAEILAGGVTAAYHKLKEFDAAGAAMVKPTDTTRVRRALEIFIDTGVSVAEWFQKPLIKVLPEINFKIVPLLPNLSDLEEKCAKRFDLMMDRGALEEVKALVARGVGENMPVMRAIGVPELAGYLKGKYPLEEAVAAAKLHTRQYAKRQLTWFRNRLKKLPAEIIALDENFREK